jgi:hypothetical protein
MGETSPAGRQSAGPAMTHVATMDHAVTWTVTTGGTIHQFAIRNGPPADPADSRLVRTPNKV